MLSLRIHMHAFFAVYNLLSSANNIVLQELIADICKPCSMHVGPTPFSVSLIREKSAVYKNLMVKNYLD